MHSEIVREKHEFKYFKVASNYSFPSTANTYENLINHLFILSQNSHIPHVRESGKLLSKPFFSTFSLHSETETHKIWIFYLFLLYLSLALSQCSFPFHSRSMIFWSQKKISRFLCSFSHFNSASNRHKNIHTHNKQEMSSRKEFTSLWREKEDEKNKEQNIKKSSSIQSPHNESLSVFGETFQEKMKREAAWKRK